MLSDCEYLSTRLRASDVAEVLAMTGEGPLEALAYSYATAKGDAWVAEVGGRPVALFGVSPSPAPDIGVVWMLGTDQAFGRRVMRYSRLFIDILHRKYQTLTNYIDADNAKTIRWLIWCGFSFMPEPVPMGPSDTPFIQFYRHR